METEQQPRQVVRHEANKTPGQNKIRHGEDRNDPRPFPRKKRSDLGVIRVERRRQIKEESYCSKQGSPLTVSLVGCSLVGQFLKKARAVPHLCITRLTVRSAKAIRHPPAPFRVSRAHAQVGLSVCCQLFLSTLKVQREVLRASFWQHILYSEAEKEKSSPLMPSMP